MKKRTAKILSLCLLLPVQIFAPTEHHSSAPQPSTPAQQTGTIEVKLASDQKTILDSAGNTMFYSGAMLILGQSGISVGSDGKIIQNGNPILISGSNLHLGQPAQQNPSTSDLKSSDTFVNANFAADQIVNCKAQLTSLFNLIKPNSTNPSYALFVLKYNQLIESGELYPATAYTQFVSEIQQLQQQAQAALGGGQATGKQAMVNDINADIAKIAGYQVKYNAHKELKDINPFATKVISGAKDFVQSASSMDDFTLGQKSTPIINQLKLLLAFYGYYDKLEQYLKENLPKIVMMLAGNGITVQNSPDMKILQQQGFAANPDPEVVAQALANILKANPKVAMSIMPTGTQIIKFLNLILMKLKELQKQNPQYAPVIKQLDMKINSIINILVSQGVTPPTPGQIIPGGDSHSYAPSGGNDNKTQKHPWDIDYSKISIMGGGSGTWTPQVNPQLDPDKDTYAKELTGLFPTVIQKSATFPSAKDLIALPIVICPDNQTPNFDAKINGFPSVLLIPLAKIPVTKLPHIIIHYQDNNATAVKITQWLVDAIKALNYPVNFEFYVSNKFDKEAVRDGFNPKTTDLPQIKFNNQLIPLDPMKRSDQTYINDFVNNTLELQIRTYMQANYPVPQQPASNNLISQLVPYLNNPSALVKLPIVQSNIPLAISTLQIMEIEPQFASTKPQIKEAIKELQQMQQAPKKK